MASYRTSGTRVRRSSAPSRPVSTPALRRNLAEAEGILAGIESGSIHGAGFEADGEYAQSMRTTAAAARTELARREGPAPAVEYGDNVLLIGASGRPGRKVYAVEAVNTQEQQALINDGTRRQWVMLTSLAVTR